MIIDKKPLILAIDTSCDDTAVAVTNGWAVISNVVATQVDLHRPYGGVFPTVAKLAHRTNIWPCIDLALKRARIEWSDLVAVAVTVGPGLAPALEVGVEIAREVARAHHLPLIAVNHLEAHLWSPLVTATSRAISPRSPRPTATDLHYPLLAMTFSGGHSHFVKIIAPQKYQLLGQTLDDAAGECLDKIGRLINLGYPAGPVIEKMAQKGDPQKYPFPLPLTTHHDFNLSFSGLKTHARHLIEQIAEPNNLLTAQQIADLSASAQNGVFRHILYKLNKLLEKQLPELISGEQIIFLAGGVAANIELRRQVRKFLHQFNHQHQTHFRIICPAKKSWCGDNASMVGAVAQFNWAKNNFVIDPDQLDRQPDWSLT